MKIRITGDGRVLEGTPEQIVQTMHYLAFGQEERTLGEYIDWAVEQARRMTEVELHVRGETDAEKAASLIDEMLRTGLAERL